MSAAARLGQDWTAAIRPVRGCYDAHRPGQRSVDTEGGEADEMAVVDDTMFLVRAEVGKAASMGQQLSMGLAMSAAMGFGQVWTADGRRESCEAHPTGHCYADIDGGADDRVALDAVEDI